MFNKYLKSISILKKFLFINFIIFTIIGLFTFIYLNNVQPNLIKKKSINHIMVIDNTIDSIFRLDIKFDVDDIRKFLFSTRFIFQNLDRVIFFDNDLNLIGDTDTLDLDPRSFSTRLDEIEFESLNENKNNKKDQNDKVNLTENKNLSFKDTRLSLPILIFFFSVISFVFFSLKISNSIISSLEENDLGSRSSVSVSPIKSSSLLKNITLSRLWKINLVENKKLLISFSLKLIPNLSKLSIVLLIILMWLDDLFLIKLGWTFFRYKNVNKPMIEKKIKLMNKNFFKIDRFFKR